MEPAHLREDRRHIRDEDIDGLVTLEHTVKFLKWLLLKMQEKIALKHKPLQYVLSQKKRGRGLQRGVRCFERRN